MLVDDHLTGVRIALVGAGRLGVALAKAFKEAGLEVVGGGPLGRGARAANADVVLLCVPDQSIAEAARVVTPGRLVGHCSGASTLAPLSPHEAFSMHPLMTVPPPDGAPSDAFQGAACAVAGSTERARQVGEALARRIGMHPFDVADEDRDVYHAAASMASNYLTTLEGAAEELGTKVGLQRVHLLPLVRAAVESWARLGARRALTGPIARGDESTVAAQRAGVARRAPELLPLWDALAASTQRLAQSRANEGAQ
jgi:predicted short-subunit dehydrogenase-like oxidoreductase (DUF2520 family)